MAIQVRSKVNENLESLLDIEYKKQMGIFYTPTEIVHFMCRESLANYLANHVDIPFSEIMSFFQNDDTNRLYKLSEALFTRLEGIDSALEDIKVFDPAVGAGVFPLGMLEEIVTARKRITEYLVSDIPLENEQGRLHLRRERHPYHLKYNTIRKGLFAADIENSAVEVTKYRLWLSLAADYDADGDLPNLPAIPELECNIKCGDSLLDELKWSEHQTETDWSLKNSGGFDIVIGNPPYISAVEGSKNNKSMREALRKKYPLLKGAFDIYTAFLLEGFFQTKKDGIYCWIVPNKLLVSSYAEPVLNFLKQNGLQYSASVSNMDVFNKVRVYPIIVTGNKSGRVKNVPYQEYIVDTMEDLKIRNLRLKNSLKSYKTFLDFNIKFASGATGFQAKLLSKYISDQITEGAIPFIVSGSVDKYSVDFSRVRYMGSTFYNAYITKGVGIADSKWGLWREDKIVIAGLTREIEAVYCSEPVALGVGAYALYDCAGFNPLFLLGLLNSKFLSWYLNVKFSEKHLAGGYLAINKSTLEQLPLIQADVHTQSMIAGIAEEIQYLRKDNFTNSKDCAEMKQLLLELDQMVYDLFSLSCAEIQEIERFYCNFLYLL